MVVGYAAGLLLVGGALCTLAAQQQSADGESRARAAHLTLVNQYCISCHNDAGKTGGLSFSTAVAHDVDDDPELWEKVIRKLRARQMPPMGMPRPDEATYDGAISSLVSQLDRAASEKPNPGRTDTFRRLTRTEYQNAVRDLLALEIDASSLLPRDELGHGFDNVTVGDLAPTLLARYLSAAEKISRLAVGRAESFPTGTTIRIRPDLTQERHFEGLPIGTRGGTVARHIFPVDAEYEIQIRLARDRDEKVEGLRESHELELLLDEERVKLFTVEPPPPEQDNSQVDQHLKVRVPVRAGPHTLGVAFLQKPWLLIETERQPYLARFNSSRHPRVQPAVYEISILGPYEMDGSGKTPSRDRIFICRPANAGEQEACAKSILSSLMRRAFRRPVTGADLERSVRFCRSAQAEGDFEAGIEMALSAILVSPDFLFRVERTPAGVEPNTPYRISDLELASRLSFLLWSSIPDDELLDLAIRGEISKPAVLEQQVRRMLADARSEALVTNFASQWLHLRNLDSITPDMRLFPDFDDNLRQSFRKETELFFESIIREDRSVLDLIGADYTFVNERLAKHYGIPHVYGSRFRRITLDTDSKRGGLLRHGSILAVTSYATRTSPVIRGKWVLDNIIGVPPPPPLPDVPALTDQTVDGSLSVRERLAEHRENPVCASCHNLMDPVGLSLENFDAVGRWRTLEAGAPINASGGLPDGSEFVGVAGLERALLQRPDLFVGTVAEKMLTYGLGRGVEYYDAPAVRKIIRETEAQDFRFSSLIMEIVNSKPFQMRRSL